MYALRTVCCFGKNMLTLISAKCVAPVATSPRAGLDVLELLISQHEKLIIDNRLPRETRKAAQARAHKEFPGWFGTHSQSQIDDGVEIHEDLQALARGPNHWTGHLLSYIINGFRFHVKSIDVEGNTQNSGVFVRAVEDNYVSARDHNPRAALLDYYGVVKDIIELEYHRGRRVVLFDCDWIDGREHKHPEEVLDRVTFFGLVYSSSKKDPTNPQPSNEEAKKKFVSADELQELENDRNEGHEVTSEVRNEIFNKVMGPETRNRVRGYGIGAKWADVPGIITQKNGMKHKLIALSEAYEAQHVANERREAALAQQLKESAEREEALRASYAQLNKKLESLETQVGANPLTQIFAAAGINSMESLDLGRLIHFLKKPDNPQAISTSNVQMGHNINQSCTTC